jgi:hypothetical protein
MELVRAVGVDVGVIGVAACLRIIIGGVVNEDKGASTGSAADATGGLAVKAGTRTGMGAIGASGEIGGTALSRGAAGG